MYFFDREDESICPICLNPHPFWQPLLESDICSNCQKQLKVIKRKIDVDGLPYYILYEYNEFLERLFFQFKEQNDRVLGSILLQGHWDWIEDICKNKTVCVCASGNEQRQKRGFEPLVEMFQEASFPIYSPFYKRMDQKQSLQPLHKRKEIKHILKLKDCYPKLKGELVLVDDVCTTGNTLLHCLSLLPIKSVFVLAAHPLWLEQRRCGSGKIRDVLLKYKT